MEKTSVPPVWVTESSRTTQFSYGMLGLAVGSVFLYGSWLGGMEPTESLAVLALGILIFSISLITLILNVKQMVSIDPGKRTVILESISILGGKRREIPFDDIADASVWQLGDREGGSISYHVDLRLKDGKDVALFFGFFEGRYDRSAMESRCRRIRKHLGDLYTAVINYQVQF